jgi:uncharacterized membrane protein YoaK (UPF0700 family)
MFDIAFILLSVIINVYIFMYLLHLEKIGCQCAVNWRRTFIMFVIGISLILSVLSIFSIDILSSAVIMGTFSILSIVNIIVIIQYVHELKEEECTCSESIAREIMQVIAILYAFIYIMLFIVLFYNGFKISNIIKMSKTLSTNNPKAIATELGKTFKNINKTAKKSFSS